MARVLLVNVVAVVVGATLGALINVALMHSTSYDDGSDTDRAHAYVCGYVAGQQDVIARAGLPGVHAAPYYCRDDAALAGIHGFTAP